MVYCNQTRKMQIYYEYLEKPSVSKRLMGNVCKCNLLLTCGWGCIGRDSRMVLHGSRQIELDPALSIAILQEMGSAIH